MAEFTQEDNQQLLSLLKDIAQTNRETVMQLRNINNNILEATLIAKTLLSFQRDELRNQKIALFTGKSGPKQRLIELYLSIGNGKTRQELINAGLPKGTVWRYCTELVAEKLLQVKKIQTDGEEVLGYTFVEELTQLSQHLEELLQTSQPSAVSQDRP
jgi:hypothetical protein